MQNKIVLITGATAGIGKVAARELAKQGATTVIVGRNPEKTAATVAEIQQISGNPQVDYLLADLSSMQQVRQLAAAFKAKYPRLDVLMNNAGALHLTRQTTHDGREMTFALNHLSYFLLTNLLLDALPADGRVVNVASGAHHQGDMNFDDLEYKKGFYSPRGAYSRSKLANVMFSRELARRLAAKGSSITSNSLHPGLVATNFAVTNNGFKWLLWGVRRVIDLMSISEDEGTETMLYLATSPEVAGVSGKYFYECREAGIHPTARDDAACRRLWEVSAEMVGLEQDAL